jgi:hypothetical protein
VTPLGVSQGKAQSAAFAKGRRREVTVLACFESRKFGMSMTIAGRLPRPVAMAATAADGGEPSIETDVT